MSNISIRTFEYVSMRDWPTPPALRTMPKSIEASIYNHVRLALRRLGAPLRLEVPGHRGLAIILDDRIWLCVDTNADDQPVMAWLDFAAHHRDNLHEPIRCNLELYHRFAGLVMGSALDSLDEALTERLMQVSD
jgi:hypothetical protein